MTIARICISAAVRAQLNKEARAWAPRESGGMLIGAIDGDTARVVRVSGPGPAADHTPDGFLRDGEHSQAALDAAVRESVGALDYLGEWHSHPIAVGASSRDARSMRAIAHDSAYQRREPILIVLLAERRSWRLQGYQWRDDRLASVAIEVGPPARGSRPRQHRS